MSYQKIEENDKVAWDYPYKGCLFDKTRQEYAECNRQDVELLVSLMGRNAEKYLGQLDWKPIRDILTPQKE